MPPARTSRYPCTPRPVVYSSRRIMLVDSIIQAGFEVIQYSNCRERRVRYIIAAYIDRCSEYTRCSIACDNVATREGLLPAPLPLRYLLTSIATRILDQVAKYKERET